MSTSTTTLPAGWMRILDDVQARLDHAVSLANARLDTLPEAPAVSAAADRLRDIAQWSERLKRLGGCIDAAELIVQNVDEILRAEDERLKETKALGESLRQGLAQQAGRAIG